MVTGHTVQRHVFSAEYMFYFPRPSLRDLGISTHAVKVNCILSSKRHYFGAGHMHFLHVLSQKYISFQVNFFWNLVRYCGVDRFWTLEEMWYLLCKGGARGDAVGWGTELQIWRSRVKLPKVFTIDKIIPAALWPCGWLGL
jgi:hypothetical protein